jgi:hypothetical protein
MWDRLLTPCCPKRKDYKRVIHNVHYPSVASGLRRLLKEINRVSHLLYESVPGVVLLIHPLLNYGVARPPVIRCVQYIRTKVDILYQIRPYKRYMHNIFYNAWRQTPILHDKFSHRDDRHERCSLTSYRESHRHVVDRASTLAGAEVAETMRPATTV